MIIIPSLYFKILSELQIFLQEERKNLLAELRDANENDWSLHFVFLYFILIFCIFVYI